MVDDLFCLTSLALHNNWQLDQTKRCSTQILTFHPWEISVSESIFPSIAERLNKITTASTSYSVLTELSLVPSVLPSSYSLTPRWRRHQILLQSYTYCIELMNEKFSSRSRSLKRECVGGLKSSNFVWRPRMAKGFKNGTRKWLHWLSESSWQTLPSLNTNHARSSSSTPSYSIFNF